MITLSPMAEAYLQALGYLDDLKAGNIEADQATTLTQRAELVAREVSARFDAMSKSGEIKDFNRGYKERRLKLASQGKVAMSYGAYVEAKKIDTVRALAFEVKRRRNVR